MFSQVCSIPFVFYCMHVLLHDLQKINAELSWIWRWCADRRLSAARGGETDQQPESENQPIIVLNQSWEIHQTELGESKNQEIPQSWVAIFAETFLPCRLMQKWLGYGLCGCWWPSQPNWEFFCPFSVFFWIWCLSADLNIAINLPGCWNRKLGPV